MRWVKMEPDEPMYLMRHRCSQYEITRDLTATIWRAPDGRAAYMILGTARYKSSD